MVNRNRYEEMDANEMFLSYYPDSLKDRKTPVDVVEASNLFGKRVSDFELLEEDRNEV